MIYAVMLAFGDSLTFGARDHLEKGWPQYLAETYFNCTGSPLLYANEGVNGEKIAGACKRAYPTIARYPAATEVVFFEGTNDSKPPSPTTPEEYSACLGYISNVSRSLGRHLYLPTLPGLSGFGSQEYDSESQRMIDAYNEVIRKVAYRDWHTLVELCDMRKKPDFYTDGCHLNSSGYREIAKRIFNSILERRKF